MHDITFENVQAGLRTDFLFRLANQHGGMVIGTSDLSELALGWATYGVGDQMSHYAVNTGVPKTLIQHVIRWVISHREGVDDAEAAVLQSVLDTEISPELVPARSGRHDAVDRGPHRPVRPARLRAVPRPALRVPARRRSPILAARAWADTDAGAWPPGFPDEDRYAYDLPTVAKWLQVFLHRYFAFAQFKRSAIPNGPKVSPAGSLSPRGDWRAPSDGNANAWIAELKAALPELVEE